MLRLPFKVLWSSNNIKKLNVIKLKSRNLSEEKKTHPEHKYSVTFVSEQKQMIKKANDSASAIFLAVLIPNVSIIKKFSIMFLFSCDLQKTIEIKTKILGFSGIEM